METIACQTCGLLQEVGEVHPGEQAECARCGEVLERRGSRSREYTLAYTLAALFLYVPANIYPMMTMDYMGRHSENTVWGGIRTLYQDHMWALAVIVFLASLVIPLLKLMGLFLLVSSRGNRGQKQRTWVYKIIHQIGPWAMLDVFLLAVLVAMLRFGKLATVEAGPGVYAFVAVVLLTLLASASFDPRLVWARGKK